MSSLVLFLVGFLILIAGYSNRADGIYMVVGITGFILFSVIAVLATTVKSNPDTPMATTKKRR